MSVTVYIYLTCIDSCIVSLIEKGDQHQKLLSIWHIIWSHMCASLCLSLSLSLSLSLCMCVCVCGLLHISVHADLSLYLSLSLFSLYELMICFTINLFNFVTDQISLSASNWQTESEYKSRWSLPGMLIDFVYIDLIPCKTRFINARL